MFLNGDNFSEFLFAFLKKEIFPKLGLLLNERICSDGSKFFSLRNDPNLGSSENDRVTYPESAPIHLK